MKNRFRDTSGRRVERTPIEYPYSFDEYVQWKNGKMPRGACWSDRLQSGEKYYKRYNKCCQEVWGNTGQLFYDREPQEIERFLQLYFEDNSIRLCLIVCGCNWANGYPYWRFEYTYS